MARRLAMVDVMGCGTWKQVHAGGTFPAGGWRRECPGFEASIRRISVHDDWIFAGGYRSGIVDTSTGRKVPWYDFNYRPDVARRVADARLRKLMRRR